MTERPKFESGQTVRLKSGGPDMTVIGHQRASKAETYIYRVVWFSETKLEDYYLPEQALIGEQAKLAVVNG